MKIHKFLHKWFYEFKYVFCIFVSRLWSDQLEFTAVFMVFNLWIGPGFIFEPNS